MKNLYIKVPGKYTIEAKFNTAYLKVWKDLGGWGHKLTDMARTQKPFDTVMADNQGIYCIEFKMIDKHILQVSDFEPGQLKAGRRLSELGQNTFAIVYSKQLLEYCVIDFKQIIKIKDQGGMEIKLNF